MRGGRSRGRSLVPPSVAAALAASQYGALPSAGATTNPRPPFPPTLPPSSAIPNKDVLQPIIDSALHIQSLLKKTPFYIDPHQNQTTGDGLERYSDKYTQKPKRDKLNSIPHASSLFPDELINTTNSLNPKGFSYSTALARLQEAELKESKLGGEPDEHLEEGAEEDNEELNEEVYEEEELEDETDYNVSYFDNGEEYGGEYDGEDGEPSY